MMKTSLFATLSALLLCYGCSSSSTNDKVAPEIETTLIDGSSFKLSELRGKYVVLDFWGSWCGPCLRDIPQLMQLHQKYGDRVEFVTVAFEKDQRRWRTVSEKAGFSWKYQIVEEAKILLASSIARNYGVMDIPAKFIVTPQGNLISNMDFEQMDAYLNASLP